MIWRRCSFCGEEFERLYVWDFEDDREPGWCCDVCCTVISGDLPDVVPCGVDDGDDERSVRLPGECEVEGVSARRARATDWTL